MFTKMLVTSLLAVGMATTAMAENTGNNASSDGTMGSGKSIVVTPNPADPNAVDPGATTSTTTGTGVGANMNSNADQNCASSPQGAQPDANNTSPGTVSPTVNDKNCGK